MKPLLFTDAEISVMTVALDYVYDYEDVSLLQSSMDINRYGKIFNSAYDKLMEYCALTHFTNEEFLVLEDALICLLRVVEHQHRKTVLSAIHKVQNASETTDGISRVPTSRP